ncbi:MAG: hypothetical protein ABSC29_01580 [Minisyncoccia bacterium]|jgi:phage terminase large subunit-like protein
MTNNQPASEADLIKTLYADRAVRTQIVRESHYWFFNFFFPHYVECAPAPFQREMFKITEDESIKLAVIVAFRGSAKSTLVTMSYALWCILGVQEKKFVLILSKTQAQAKAHFANIKRELEFNEMLRAHLGPFETKDDEWGSYTIVLSRYGARITIASSEQSIRGLRHGAFRPQVILADDVEDLQSVKTLEGRDKAHEWFVGEVIPAGDRDSRIVVVGNLLHDDSLLKRLVKGIEDGILTGIYKFYPLVDADGKILWPGKYPDMAAVESERKRVGNEAAWQREYLLKIIPDSERVVREEWIHYYDGLPSDYSDDFRFAATGIDLAIAENATNDYTAMVSAKVFGYRENLRIFILPNPVNERLDFPDQLERAKALSRSLGSGVVTKLFIESDGYQRSLVQQLQRENYPAFEFQTRGHDKRARLSITTNPIYSGTILFPRHGAEQLIQQLLNFGSERHEDLADAFAILIFKILESDTGGITFPRPYGAAEAEQQKTREELERDADNELIEESNRERSKGNWRNSGNGPSSRRAGGFMW